MRYGSGWSQDRSRGWSRYVWQIAGCENHPALPTMKALVGVLAAIAIFQCPSMANEPALYMQAHPGRYLFVALQEASYGRARLGEWIPEVLVDCGDQRFQWAFDDFKREQSQLSFRLWLMAPSKPAFWSQIGFFSKGPSGPLVATVKAAERGVIVELAPDSEGVMRHLWIVTFDDLEAFKKSASFGTTVKPLWNWTPRQPYH
jgi:hypothetical protein